MKLDTHNKLSINTLFLHWLVGIMMIALLATGIYMEENEVFALYPWHKSFGVLIITFVLLRVYWRIKNGWLSPVSEYSTIEKKLSKIVHYTLIIGTVLMPISGFIMSSAGGHGVSFFAIELVARNPDPANIKEVIAHNAAIADFAHGMHGIVGKVILFAVILHVIGAFKHHIIDKDGTLRRMLGSQI